MKSKWTVVAPVDSSRRADEWTQHAAGLANVLGANLHFLRVADGSARDGAGQDWPSSIWDIAGAHEVSRAVVEGDPPTSIASYAESVDADLMLMASNTFARWTRFWKRPVAEQVMDLTRRPVCVTSEHNVDPDFRFRTFRVLCVVELSGGETELIREAEAIAERTGSELVLVHVMPDASEGLLHYAVESSSRPLSPDLARTQLAALASTLRVRTTTSVLIGDRAKCVALAAREHRVDLVLAPRAHRDSGAVYGSHAPDLLPKLYCPLLTVPFDRAATVHSSGNKAARKLLRFPSRASVSTVVRQMEDRVYAARGRRRG